MSEVEAILAIGDRKNNAELMRDCAALGYFPAGGDTDRVLDMTYGLGRFWKLYRPGCLVTNDLDEATDTHFHYDFTALPSDWSGQFDTVVFDPPYKLNGTGGSHPSDLGYGVANKGKGRMSLILAGFEEAVRVCAPGGHVLVKCQDQVCSGTKNWQTFRIAARGFDLGLFLVDQLHVRSYRPQPAGRRQLHSRGDYSTLLVFKKGKS